MGLFGSDSKQKQESTPWQPAEGALRESLDMVQGANNNPWSVYGGQQIADFTPDQLAAMQQGRGFYGSNGLGNEASRTMFDVAGQNLQGYGQAQQGYQQAMGWDPAQNTGPDQRYIDAYMNNPYLDQQIDAVNRDVQRGLFEQELPGIAQASAGSGNLGSSRRGTMEAIAMRGAGDRMADNAAAMRGDQLNRGMAAASAAAQQNAALTMQNRGLQMNAMAGLAGLGQAGAANAGQAYGMQQANQQGLMDIGNIWQQQNQNNLTQQTSDHYLGQQLPYQQAAAGSGIALPMAQAFGTTTMSGSGGPGVGNQLINAGMQVGSGYLAGR